MKIPKNIEEAYTILGETDHLPKTVDETKKMLVENGGPVSYVYTEFLFGVTHEYVMRDLGFKYEGKRNMINFGEPSRDGVWVKK